MSPTLFGVGISLTLHPRVAWTFVNFPTFNLFFSPLKTTSPYPYFWRSVWFSSFEDLMFAMVGLLALPWTAVNTPALEWMTYSSGGVSFSGILSVISYSRLSTLVLRLHLAPHLLDRASPGFLNWWGSFPNRVLLVLNPLFIFFLHSVIGKRPSRFPGPS